MQIIIIIIIVKDIYLAQVHRRHKCAKLAKTSRINVFYLTYSYAHSSQI